MHTRTFENMVATQATKIDISTILSGADGLEDAQGIIDCQYRDPDASEE